MEQNNSQEQEQIQTHPQSEQAPLMEVQEPKKGHSRTLKVILGLLVLVSCAIAVYLTSLENKEQVVVPQKPVQIEDPIEDPYPVDDNDATWKEYTNQKYEFYMKYPANGVLTQYDISQEEPSVFKVYFTPDQSSIQNIENVEEKDINEGLLFKIVVVKDIELKTPETAAEEKINFYNSLCPKNAEISTPRRGKFSGFDSSSFTVTECRGSYKVTYVKRKTNMYEITQFSKGDIGYEPRYKATTEKMLNNLRLTNTIAPVPVEKWVDYKSGVLNLKHPEMDDKCCSITGPIPIEGYKAFTPIIVLAMPNPSNSTANSFNGFGVFSISNVTDENLNTLIEQQQNALVEEYKIIVGKNPTIENSTIKVGGIESTYSKGVAWWGDMVFVPYKNPKGTITLYMFAKTEVLKGEFDTLFEEILSTVEFIESKR